MVLIVILPIIILLAVAGMTLFINSGPVRILLLFLCFLFFIPALKGSAEHHLNILSIALALCGSGAILGLGIGNLIYYAKQFRHDLNKRCNMWINGLIYALAMSCITLIYTNLFRRGNRFREYYIIVAGIYSICPFVATAVLKSKKSEWSVKTSRLTLFTGMALIIGCAIGLLGLGFLN